MVIKPKKIVWSNLKRKTSLLMISILLFLGNSFILENPSNTSSARQIGGTAVANAIQSTNPVQLDSIIYDHYSNGKIVNRGSNKDPLPRPTSTYSHPLSKNDTLVIGREEIAVIPGPGPEPCFILDDAYNEFQKIHKLPNAYKWQESNLIAGNIDEDPFDELLIISSVGLGRAHIYVYDDANHSYNLIWDQELTFASDREVKSSNIAVGNFDDDPLNEIVVLLLLWVPDNPHPYAYASALYYVIDLNESPIDIVQEALWPGTNEVAPSSDLGVGDFDHDGRDEFAIIVALHWHFVNCWVFDDALSNFVQLGDTFGGWGSWVHLEVGDFDGDGDEEIAIANSNYYAWEAQYDFLEYGFLRPGHYPSLAIWEYVGGSFEATELQLATYHIESMELTAGDFDGDGRDEIAVFTLPSDHWYFKIELFEHQFWKEFWVAPFANSERRGYIYEYSDTTYTYEITKVWTDSAFYPDGDPYPFMDNYFFTTGDIDGDGLDEILSSGTATPTMALNDAKNGYAPMMVPNEIYKGRLVCGDFDGDGVILRYTGESCIVDAPPAVVAVIAAPPCYAGIDQNYASSWTGWGTETIQGTEESTNVGTTVSTTISFEKKSTFFWVSVGESFSSSFREEFARTNTIEKTEAVSRSYNSGWTDDAVIFHQTSYTSYLYQITAHPMNESLVGTYMTIDVPEAPVLHKVGLNDFNANYAGINLGAETFTHTPGQPWTYPSQEDVPLITRNWLGSGDPMEVGQGTGFNFAEIQITETIKKGFETTRASEFATGFSIGGGFSIAEIGTGIEMEISFEYSQGVFETKAYAVSMGERTYYEGSVGDIAEWDVWNQTKYTYGLFIYYQSHPGGCLYLVVNYYVDGAIPYPPDDGGLFDSIPGYEFMVLFSVSAIFTIGIIYIYMKKNKFK